MLVIFEVISVFPSHRTSHSFSRFVIYFKWIHINPLSYLVVMYRKQNENKKLSLKLSFYLGFCSCGIASFHKVSTKSPSLVFFSHRKINCNRPIHIVKTMLEYQGKLDILRYVNSFTNHRQLDRFFSYYYCYIIANRISVNRFINTHYIVIHSKCLNIPY